LLARPAPQKAVVKQHLAPYVGHSEYQGYRVAQRHNDVHLARALSRVARHIVRNLVAQHGRQPVLAAADGQDAAEDEDLASDFPPVSPIFCFFVSANDHYIRPVFFLL
jgi:hypothetical protein